MCVSVFFNTVDRAWGNVTEDNLALMQEATIHVKWLRDHNITTIINANINSAEILPRDKVEPASPVYIANCMFVQCKGEVLHDALLGNNAPPSEEHWNAAGRYDSKRLALLENLYDVLCRRELYTSWENSIMAQLKEVDDHELKS